MAGFSYGSLVTGIWKRFYWKLQRHQSLLFPPPPDAGSVAAAELGGGRSCSLPYQVLVHARPCASPLMSPGGRWQPGEAETE